MGAPSGQRPARLQPQYKKGPCHPMAKKQCWEDTAADPMNAAKHAYLLGARIADRSALFLCRLDLAKTARLVEGPAEPAMVHGNRKTKRAAAQIFMGYVGAAGRQPVGQGDLQP